MKYEKCIYKVTSLGGWRWQSGFAVDDADMPRIDGQPIRIAVSCHGGFWSATHWDTGKWVGGIEDTRDNCVSEARRVLGLVVASGEFQKQAAECHRVINGRLYDGAP